MWAFRESASRAAQPAAPPPPPQQQPRGRAPGCGRPPRPASPAAPPSRPAPLRRPRRTRRSPPPSRTRGAASELPCDAHPLRLLSVTPGPPTTPAAGRGLRAGKTRARPAQEDQSSREGECPTGRGPRRRSGASLRGERARGAGGGLGPRRTASPEGGRPLPAHGRLMAFSRNGKGGGSRAEDAAAGRALPPACLRRARRHCILLASPGVLEQQGEEEPRVISQSRGGRAGGERSGARAAAAVRPTALPPAPARAPASPGGRSLPTAPARAALPRRPRLCGSALRCQLPQGGSEDRAGR